MQYAIIQFLKSNNDLQRGVIYMSHFIKEGIKMFEAVILICLLGNDCVELTDIRGPYKTEVECKARVSEMIKDFIGNKETPPVITFDFKCSKPEGLST